LKDQGWLFSIKEIEIGKPLGNGHIMEFYGVEGCHSIADHIDPTKIDSKAIINNLKKLLDNKIPIMNLMLVHMEQSPLANHAYGIQMLDNEKENSFKPTGKTITPGAFEIIDFCNENNIYIDVKHMSYAARQSFYHKWATMPNKRPVICSHTGIAGISADLYRFYVMDLKWISEKSVYVALAKPLAFGGWVSFNPVSINLYDEDIEFIINSGGLIGLSFDMRIIGVSKVPSVPSQNKYHLPHEEEYLAKADLTSHGSPVLSIPKSKPDSPSAPKLLDYQDLDTLAKAPVNNIQYHINCFVAQFIHVINIAMKKCGKSQDEAFRYVCFGSDMDGLIAGMYGMENYNKFNNDFRKEFISAFKFIWKQGFNEGSIPEPLKISDSVLFNRISFKNGFDFTEKWMSK
jgi:microsomal dipeptidase-like Zn-dependent dipeptidase